MFAIHETVGLAKWIIDDTPVLFYVRSKKHELLFKTHLKSCLRCVGFSCLLSVWLVVHFSPSTNHSVQTSQMSLVHITVQVHVVAAPLPLLPAPVHVGHAVVRVKIYWRICLVYNLIKFIESIPWSCLLGLWNRKSKYCPFKLHMGPMRSTFDFYSLLAEIFWHRA